MRRDIYLLDLKWVTPTYPYPDWDLKKEKKERKEKSPIMIMIEKLLRI